MSRHSDRWQRGDPEWLTTPDIIKRIIRKVKPTRGGEFVIEYCPDPVRKPSWEVNIHTKLLIKRYWGRTMRDALCTAARKVDSEIAKWNK